MTAARPISAWWLLILCIGASLFAGCMGEDEEPVAVWVVSSQMSASRRYAIQDGKRERVYTLKRRGPTLMLTNSQSRPLAKASIRRGDKSVVVRNGAGEIVATAKRQGAQIELVDKAGKALATIGPFGEEAAPLELNSGEATFTFSNADPILIEGGVPNPRHAKRSVSKLEKVLISNAENEDELLFSVDARSGLGTLAFAVLTLEPLEPTTRLGLAAFLSEFEASFGKQ